MSLVSTTFAVSPVEPSQEMLPVDSEGFRPHFEGGDFGGPLVDIGFSNQLFGAVYLAFQEHYPLVLSPDIIWITLLQGIARHIQKSPESLRNQLVAHSGKRRLQVRADHLVKGSPDNDWTPLFPTFSSLIQEHTHPSVHSRLSPRFSTTGPAEEISTLIAVMDALSSFFDFTTHSICGIPSVTLEGTPEDWALLRKTLASWAPIGLQTWIRALDPCLEQFELSARGQVHPHFWNNIYLHGGALRSGEQPRFDGWLALLFPYLQDPTGSLFPNPMVARHSDYLSQLPPLQRGGGFCEQRQLPTALSRVPFQWLLGAEQYSMELVGGIFGMEQDPHTLSLRPRIGWAVGEAS